MTEVAHGSAPPAKLPDARRIASRVVERVLRDAAYLSRALDAELARHPQLSSRDRALCTELSYGSVRTYAFLVTALEKYAKRKLPAKDSELMAELVVAAYQILLLERVPASAAVNAAVSQVRRKRGARVAGFSNGLLRNLARHEPKAERQVAVLASLPSWLHQRLGTLGREELLALVGAGAPPPLVARLVGGGTRPPEFASARPCRWACNAFELSGPLTADQRRGRTWVVQEEGAQLIGWALGAGPGDQVLDACAGRGGKTSLLAEILRGNGCLWAVDAHPHKLETLRRDFERLGLDPPRTAAVDWTAGQGPVPHGFQRALVDAPCTGSGTLRRRPELLLRLKPDDPVRMGELQETLVRSVATRLVPGGTLLYAVCSVFEEEAEAVVERVGDILEPTPFASPVVQKLAPAGQSQLRLLPGAHGTDGYFLANLRLK